MVASNVKRWMMCAAIAAVVLPWRATAESAVSESAADVTVITSDKLTYDYVKQYAFFEGNVVVVDPSMKIYADSMMVEFDENNSAKSIRCEGNVVITQQDKRAKSDVATYDVASGMITLHGDPMLTSGKNILTADVVKFWRDENRAVFEPNSRLVIYPDDDTNDTLFGDPTGGR